MTTSTQEDVLRLTSLARCAGCAAKLGLGDLAEALSGVPVHADPRLLVGREGFDDAGVFVLRDDLALVQTVDFFAPIVDDPYEFGQIAAANALSDVFAMGGEPLTALAIVGFPSGKLPLSVLTDILRGGSDKVREAGAVLVGGHSIIDEELKFGLSVTGQAHPQKLLTNAAATVGDVLVLTKSAWHRAPRHCGQAESSRRAIARGAARVHARTERDCKSRRPRARGSLRD
jgi:selenide,water dikinase